MTEYAARHRQHAAAFAEVVAATHDWGAQSPVPEWSAGDVVDHLLSWLSPVVRTWAGVELPSPGAGMPREQAWAMRTRAVQDVLEGESREVPVCSGPFAGQPLGAVIDRIYTSDVFMHTWDLAASNAIPVTLDEGYALDLLTGMKAIEDVLRDSGQYGPPRATESNDPVRRLMAFVGRDVDAYSC